MKNKISQRAVEKTGNTSSGLSRQAILFGAIAITALVVGAFIAARQEKPRESEVAVATPVQKSDPRVSKAAILKSELRNPGVTIISRPVPDAPATPPTQLVSAMIELGGSREGISKEQAEKFKQNVSDLIKQGAASVPAIQEFLAKNVDTDYSELQGGDQLGYSSLRASMFDALNQIGGPEAQAAMLQALQTTATPAEILELSKNLEQQSPGEYRDEILKAVHETLELSSANQLGNNVEVGPAFHVLETFGNANAQNSESSNPVKANPQ